jgi:hypothetical protein
MIPFPPTVISQLLGESRAAHVSLVRLQGILAFAEAVDNARTKWRKS